MEKQRVYGNRAIFVHLHLTAHDKKWGFEREKIIFFLNRLWLSKTWSTCWAGWSLSTYKNILWQLAWSTSTTSQTLLLQFINLATFVRHGFIKFLPNWELGEEQFCKIITAIFRMRMHWLLCSSFSLRCVQILKKKHGFFPVVIALGYMFFILFAPPPPPPPEPFPHPCLMYMTEDQAWGPLAVKPTLTPHYIYAIPAHAMRPVEAPYSARYPKVGTYRQTS